MQERSQLNAQAPERTDHQMLALWAAACAERVLSLFEDASPNDNRPRMAIGAARSWAHGDLKMTDARKIAFASHAAARETNDKSARLAARAAGHAAATAHVATHSPHAAAYAIKAIAAQYAGRELDAILEAEEEWQILLLPDHLKHTLKNPA